MSQRKWELSRSLIKIILNLHQLLDAKNLTSNVGLCLHSLCFGQIRNWPCIIRMWYNFISVYMSYTWLNHQKNVELGFEPTILTFWWPLGTQWAWGLKSYLASRLNLSSSGAVASASTGRSVSRWPTWATGTGPSPSTTSLTSPVTTAWTAPTRVKASSR